MRILFDTNVLIPAEPTSEADVTDNTRLVSLLLQEIRAASHEVFLHPSIARDILADRDDRRRATRSTLAKKYCLLSSPPAVPQALSNIIGLPEPGSHDEVDDELLAAAFCNAVDFLVTEDGDVLRKAAKAGISHRVLTIYDMLRALQALNSSTPVTMPAVTAITCDQLNISDPIFESLRGDYEGFDSWMEKCREERRKAYVIIDGERYGAISIIKPKLKIKHGSGGNVMKICTFKVGFDWTLSGYGELLLRDVLNYASEKGYDRTYLTVLPKHRALLRLLSTFGFFDCGERSNLNELVYSKLLRYTEEDYRNLSSLDFHIKYGPRHIKVQGAAGYIIPIRPKYHAKLFPDAQVQLGLLPGTYPCGNAILKAYLCHSPTVAIEPGAILLFYRSGDEQAVRCIGVAESSIRSIVPNEVLRFVGSRAVYSSTDIEELTDRGEVLAVLFRYARSLTTPLPLRKLRSVGLLTTAPQSIVQIDEKGMEWLQKSLQQLP